MTNQQAFLLISGIIFGLFGRRSTLASLSERCHFQLSFLSETIRSLSRAASLLRVAVDKPSR